MITSPQNDIPLPEDIKKKYDAAKNAVTMAEAEVARLRDLRISEEVTIVELNKQIKYAEEQHNEIAKKLASLKDKIAENAEKITLQKTEIDSNQTKIEESANILIERENACAEKELAQKNKRIDLDLHEAFLKERMTTIIGKEVAVAAREKKLKEFSETI